MFNFIGMLVISRYTVTDDTHLIVKNHYVGESHTQYLES